MAQTEGAFMPGPSGPRRAVQRGITRRGDSKNRRLRGSPYTTFAKISVIEVKIDRAGYVTSTRVIDGHPLLRKIKSIEVTALRWRFIPATDHT